MALLELVVKSSLILALGLAAAYALRGRSASLRHWIIAMAVFGAAATPAIATFTPSWTMAAFSAVDEEPAASVDVSFSPIGVVSSAAANMPAASQPSAVGDWLPGMAIGLWVAGIAANLLLLLIGMFRLRHLRCTSERLDDVEVAGLRRRVTLLRSTRPAVIVTWGVVHPKVVLPVDSDSWSRERRDVVLAHEIAHIMRGDWLVQTAAGACKAIYWFNPLFWIACARLRYESERACDDAVIRTGVTSHVYATELLEVARSVGRRRQEWLPAPAMAARPSNLERRVRAMLNAHLDRGPITPRGRWTSAVALLAVALPIATLAQGGFLTFSGTVIDPQDRLLPAATVTVTDTQRSVKHETKTDRNGRFELIGLPAGDYSFEVKLPGFGTLTDTLTLSGQSVDRPLKMRVGELQETITVTGEDGVITSSREGASVSRPSNAPRASAPASCTPGTENGIGGNIRPPRKTKDVRPGYPGVSGNVQLAATIGPDGKVAEVEVVKADRPELGPAAIDAVRQWEFTSTLLNCVPIDVRMNVAISFRQK